MLGRLAGVTIGCSAIGLAAFPASKLAVGRRRTVQCEYLSEEAKQQRLQAEGAKQCAFCTAMVSSPCGVEFLAWEQCLDQNQEDFINKCGQVTKALSECMSANPEYFEKQRAAEERQIKAREQQLAEEEQPKEQSEQNS